MITTPNTTITNRKVRAGQPSPAHWLDRARGADAACELCTENLLPQTDDAVYPERNHIALNPDINDVADFGFTIARKYYLACAGVAGMTYRIFSYIFHAAYPAFA